MECLTKYSKYPLEYIFYCRIVDIIGYATAISKKTNSNLDSTVLSQFDIISASINPKFGMHSGDPSTDSLSESDQSDYSEMFVIAMNRNFGSTYVY